MTSMTTISIELGGGRVGIGVDEELMVKDVADDLPAARSGVTVGMKILRVNAVPVVTKKEFVKQMGAAIACFKEAAAAGAAAEPLTLLIVKRIALEVAKPWACEDCGKANLAYTIRCGGCERDHPLRANATTAHARFAKRVDRGEQLGDVERTDYESLAALLQIGRNDGAGNRGASPEKDPSGPGGGGKIAAAASFFGKKTFSIRRKGSGTGLAAEEAAAKPEEVQWTRAQDNRLRHLQGVPEGDRTEEEAAEHDLLLIGFNRFIDHGVALMKEQQAKDEARQRERELGKSKSWFVRRDSGSNVKTNGDASPTDASPTSSEPSRAKSFMKGMAKGLGAVASAAGARVVGNNGSSSPEAASPRAAGKKRVASVTVINPTSPAGVALHRRQSAEGGIKALGSGSGCFKRGGSGTGSVRAGGSLGALWSRSKDKRLQELRAKPAASLTPAEAALLNDLQSDFQHFLDQDAQPRESGSPTEILGLGRRVNSVRSEMNTTCTSIQSSDTPEAASRAPHASVFELWSHEEDARLQKLRAREAVELSSAEAAEKALLEARFERFVEHGLGVMLASRDANAAPKQPSASMSSLLERTFSSMSKPAPPPVAADEEGRRTSPSAKQQRSSPKAVLAAASGYAGALRPDKLLKAGVALASSPRKKAPADLQWTRAEDNRLRDLRGKLKNAALTMEEQAEYGELSDRNERFLAAGVEQMKQMAASPKSKREKAKAKYQGLSREEYERHRALEGRSRNGGVLSETAAHELDTGDEEVFVAEGVEQIRAAGSPTERPGQWTRAQDNRLRDLTTRRDRDGAASLSEAERNEYAALSAASEAFVEEGLQQMAAAREASESPTSTLQALKKTLKDTVFGGAEEAKGAGGLGGRRASVQCMWSRRQDDRMRDLIAMSEGRGDAVVLLTPAEEREMAELRELYEAFVDEGVRLLADGAHGFPEGRRASDASEEDPASTPPDQWTRAEDNRLRELASREAVDLTAAEASELKALQARFDVFIQEGLEELVGSAPPAPAQWTREHEQKLHDLRASSRLALSTEEEAQLAALEARFEACLNRGQEMLKTAKLASPAPVLWSRADEARLRELNALAAPAAEDTRELAALLERLDRFTAVGLEQMEAEAAKARRERPAPSVLAELGLKGKVYRIYAATRDVMSPT